MTAAIAPHKAFAVWFKDLDRWNVSSFYRIQWKWPPGVIRPLADALERKLLPVDRSKVPFLQLQLITLHFDGEMEPRDMQGKISFKGKLFQAEAGNVIYSKIDVRNGAIGVVPEQLPKIAVSSEYPVYYVRPEIALADYVKLLFRTSAFRQQINSMISGASGRKRVQPSDLEKLEVPLPPLPIQKLVVAHWRAAQEAVARSRETMEKLESEKLSRFFTFLGLKPPKTGDVPKAFAVSWKDFFRWSVSYNQAVLDSGNLSRGKYPVMDLGELLSYVQYGTSEKANSFRRGTAIIRMNNIKNGLLDLADLKHIAINANERGKLLLQDGDILFNRTNSKELVGKCAVFHEAGEYIFASYLIRVKVSAERALPDYVAFFLNSPLGRQQINAMSRHIIGQANINSEELKGFQISVPPLEVQREIVDMVNRQRQSLAVESKVAEEWQTRSRREVEEIILGIRPVPH